MPEHEGIERGRLDPHQQFGFQQRTKRRPQIGLRAAGHDGAEQREREPPPQRGCDTRHLPRDAEPVEARQQRSVQTGRNDKRIAPVARLALARGSAGHHRLGQFLQIERHAVRALRDAAHDFAGQVAGARHATDEILGLAATDRFQLDQRRVLLEAPRRLELLPARHQQHHRPVADTPDEQVEQLARGRIDPVRVVDDHQPRLRAGQPPQVAGDALQQHLAQPPCIGRRPGARAVHRHCQQFRNQRSGADAALAVLRQERLEALERLGIGAIEPRGPPQPLQDRVQRAALMLRGAIVAQQQRRIRPYPAGEFESHARLADTGVAAHDHHLPGPALCQGPAIQQRRHLFVAADERQVARAQGLEAACHLARPQRLPRLHGPREAFERPAAEIAIVEQPARQPPRRIADQHGTRISQRLQACSEVRRLAHHRRIVRNLGAQQLPDNDHPRGDTDADAQRAVQHPARLDARGQLEPRAHRAIGIVLIGSRIAEVGEHAVSLVARHAAAGRLHHGRDARLVRHEHVAQIFRIEARGKRGRTDQIAEHDGEEPALR